MSSKCGKLKKFRESDLIGCLNETGIISENYKEVLMLSDIAKENSDYPERLTISMNGLFERDLNYLLQTLEKVCQGNANHIDYVSAYKYFFKQWCPDID